MKLEEQLGIGEAIQLNHAGTSFIRLRHDSDNENIPCILKASNKPAMWSGDWRGRTTTVNLYSVERTPL